MGTAHDRRITFDEVKGVLIEDAGHGFIQFGELMPEGHGAFEEYFYCNCPKFVVVSSRLISEEVFCAAFALLHSCTDGAGYFGEVGEFLFKVFVFLRLGNKIDIGQGMCHFVDSNVTVRRLTRDPFYKIIPGKVDPGLVYMSHEGAGIESIVIIVSEDEDIVEIVKLESFKAEGQLNGGGAD